MARGLELLLQAIPAPIIAATSDAHGALLIHVAASEARRKALAAQIRAALPGRQFAIRLHREAALHTPRSLERLVHRFGTGAIVFDPTGAISRARALVETAQATRALLGGKVSGVFYAPRARTLFVALDAKRVTNGGKIKVGDLAAIERQIAATVGGTFADWCPAIRVGFGIPAIELVPVDQRSVAGWSARALAALRRYWKPVAVAALFGFGASAPAAAEGPAVSETNVKVTGLRGSVDDDDTWFANAMLTAPLGHAWGLQVEGAVSDVDGATTWGGAAHIFTRDPERYLLGLFAAHAEQSDFDIDATRLGAEAELYLNQVSILLAAGYQFSDTIEETAFGDIEVRWYATDDFTVSVGGSFAEDTSIGRAGLEWQPGFAALPGLAFRVEGAIGDDDYHSIMGGLTYYFGSDASLKDRHRRQDPDSALDPLFGAVDQERRRLESLYGPPPG